jgi:DNA-binding LytR/AlgR family response regulator
MRFGWGELVVYRVAIVEDDSECAERLEDFLNAYEQKHQVLFQTARFSNGMAFLMNYQADWDIVFMDIEMPHMNGMETARHLREMDQDVCLIFVTHMAQYAIEGYEVRALDFILKPVEYGNFSIKLKKAIDARERMRKRELMLNTAEGIRRIEIDDIFYVEVMNHTLIYHTRQGELSVRGSIKDRERMLEEYDFARCNNSYLVNLRYVKSVTAGDVTVRERVIPIGRTKKKEFMQRLTAYMGANI